MVAPKLPAGVRVLAHAIHYTFIEREICMGRSYWFECSKCGYRARVSGRADQGLRFVVQTILCHDCRELYDAVTRLKVPNEWGGLGNLGSLRRVRLSKAHPRNATPPTFQAVLNWLLPKGMGRHRWLPFEIQCPVSVMHRVRNWNSPDRCPRCGVHLEKSALPYRLWD